MNRIFALILLAIPMHISATTDVEVSVFSKTVKLIGDCKFHPYILKRSNFVCTNKGGVYLASFISPEMAQVEFSETIVTTEKEKALTFRVSRKVRKEIDGFLHYNIVGETPEGDFSAYRYQICGVKKCISLSSQEEATILETLLQLSPVLIEQ